jgi:hypothetical protein
MFISNIGNMIEKVLIGVKIIQLRWLEQRRLQQCPQRVRGQLSRAV